MILGQAIGPDGSFGPWAPEYATGYVTDSSAAAQDLERQRAAARARAEREAGITPKPTSTPTKTTTKTPALSTAKPGGFPLGLVAAGLGVGAAIYFFTRKRTRNPRRRRR